MFPVALIFIASGALRAYVSGAMSIAPFTDATITARQLGVPRSWLLREVEAGRIKFINVGRRRMFDAEAIRKSLKERETVATTEGAPDG